MKTLARTPLAPHPAPYERARSRILIFLVTLVTIGSIQPEPSISQPRLSIDKTTVDLGAIYRGASKSARLTLKNAGSDTLKIFRVDTSCGCTTVKHPKPFLLPGESDILEAAVNSTGLAVGKAKKVVTIETNDPSSASLSVILLADIREELEPTNQTSALYLGNLPVGKQTQRRVAFRNISGHPIAVKGDTTSSPTLIVEVEHKTVPPADSVQVTVTITPAQEGYVNEQFFLKTDSKNQSLVPMRVTYTGVKSN